MRRIILLLPLLAGCSTAGHGLTPAWQQRGGYTLNSRAVCLDDPRLLPAAELALVLLADEAARAGYAASYEAAARAIAARRPGVCLVPSPEPCCLGPLCQRDTDGEVRAKAGCAGDGWAWVSAQWPAGTARDWRGDLLHELGHVVAEALSVPQRANHATPWAEVEKRAAARVRW